MLFSLWYNQTCSVGETSVCTDAPTWSEISKQLEQWSDLLNDTRTDDVDGNQIHIELISQTKLENGSMDAIQAFLRQAPSDEIDDACLRPTAASLGLGFVEDNLNEEEETGMFSIYTVATDGIKIVVLFESSVPDISSMYILNWLQLQYTSK